MTLQWQPQSRKVCDLQRQVDRLAAVLWRAEVMGESTPPGMDAEYVALSQKLNETF